MTKVTLSPSIGDTRGDGWELTGNLGVPQEPLACLV